MQVIIYGICGRMGRAILEQTNSQIEVIGGIDKPNSACNLSVPVFASLAECNLKCDVVIDFSSPSSLNDIIDYCKKHNAGVVLATTGYSATEEALIVENAKHFAVVRSGNMSLGVNLLAMLVKKAYQALGDDFDIEIIEKHHNQKVDAPSGTALLLADAVNSQKQHEIVNGREGASKRKNEIGIHAVRGGTIVGEHDVIFAGADEVITLSHSAQSRKIFALGAIKAALFLKNKKYGFYSMQNVLGID